MADRAEKFWMTVQTGMISIIDETMAIVCAHWRSARRDSGDATNG